MSTLVTRGLSSLPSKQRGREPNMSFKVKINKLATRKVPAISLILMMSVGMVAGALAATMVVTSNSRSAEGGTYHSSTGVITFTDNGLAVNANSITANSSTSFTWGATGTNKQVYFSSGASSVAGDWVDSIVFSTSLTDSSTHVATVTVRDGSGAVGTTLETFSTGTWTGPGSSSTATITVYLDLGSATLTAPVTVYVSVT